MIADIGLPIVSQGYLHSALPLARRALRKWIQARSRNQDIPFFFIISQTPNDTGGPTVSIHENAVVHDPTAEITITINLSLVCGKSVSAKWLSDGH